MVLFQKLINCEINGKLSDITISNYFHITTYMNFNENNNRERFSINLIINRNAFQVVIHNLLINNTLLYCLVLTRFADGTRIPSDPPVNACRVPQPYHIHFVTL